jgi:hypothetical protein
LPIFDKIYLLILKYNIINPKSNMTEDSNFVESL